MEEIGVEGTPIDMENFNLMVEGITAGNQEALDLSYQFIQREDAWTQSDTIFQNSVLPMGKMVALQALLNYIDHLWTTSEDPHETITSFVTSQIQESISAQLSADATPESIQSEKVILSSLDTCFVHILLYEWPENMPTFMNDLIEQSAQNPSLSNNYLVILHRLYEELDEENEDKSIIEYDRLCSLRNLLGENSDVLFNFVFQVMTESENPEVVSTSLKLIKEFLPRLNPELIQSSNLFELIGTQYLSTSELVSPVIGIIGEIFFNPILSESLAPLVESTFKTIVTVLQPQIPVDYDAFTEFFLNSENSQDLEYFAKMLSFTLSVFLDQWGPQIESVADIEEFHQTAKMWMLNLTLISRESENFFSILNSCSEFWFSIIKRTLPQGPDSYVGKAYGPIFPQLRRVLVRLMPKPKEVLIEVTDQHEVRRIEQSDTIDTMLFTALKNTLKSLARLDVADTIEAIKEQFNQACSEMDVTLYDSTCYSMSALAGTMPKEVENAFINEFLGQQLQFFNHLEDPLGRALVAAGIMYVCTQYPKFLANYPNLLFAVLDKLFEFMKQDVPGLQEMAVDSFTTISKSNSIRMHITQHTGVSSSYLATIITEQLPQIVELLPRELIFPFYQSVAAITMYVQKEMQDYLQLMLEPLNERWDFILSNFDPLDIECAYAAAHVLNSNAAIAEAVGKQFANQISEKITQIMQVYQRYSEVLNEYSQQQGYPTKEPLFIAILRVKSAAIKLVSTYISKLSHTEIQKIADDLLQQIIPGMIVEYQESAETTRVPELLDLAIGLFKKMNDTPGFSDQIPVFFESIFQITSTMISANFEDYPSFRLPLYTFIYEMVDKFVDVLVRAPDELFNLLMETIFWGIQHPQHEICTLSIRGLTNLCEKIFQLGGTYWSSFLGSFLLKLILKTFENMIDTIHKFAFDDQITLLMASLSLINDDDMINSIGESLMQIFPNSDKDELALHLNKMIEMSKNDRESFRQSVRDFLVMTKHYKPMDPALIKEEQDKQNEEYLEYINAVVEDDFMA